VLRSGGDERITMLRFVERVNEDERESLRGAMLDMAGQLAAS
jgi:hypothetical protein